MRQHDRPQPTGPRLTPTPAGTRPEQPDQWKNWADQSIRGFRLRTLNLAVVTAGPLPELANYAAYVMLIPLWRHPTLARFAGVGTAAR